MAAAAFPSLRRAHRSRFDREVARAIHGGPDGGPDGGPAKAGLLGLLETSVEPPKEPATMTAAGLKEHIHAAFSPDGHPPSWWRERIAVLGRGAADPAYPVARGELMLEMERLALRARGPYRDVLDDEYLDVVRDAIGGRDSRASDPDGRGGEDAPRRKGVLRFFEELPDAGAIKDPAAYWKAALDGWLKDEAARRSREVKPDPEPRPDEGRWEGAGREPAGHVIPDGRPDAIPRDVARTLRDAVSFVAVAVEVAPALPPDHPLHGLPPAPPSTEDRSRSLDARQRAWWETERCIARDLALREQRLRWDAEARVRGTDLSARAWQAEFYDYEGPPEYTGPEEIPATGAPLRAIYEKHLSRFRARYWDAAAVAAWVVREGSQEPAFDAPRAGERRRLPLREGEWEPADHPTLRSSRRGGAAERGKAVQ